MRLLCAPLALTLLVLSSGCGFVHFGRLPDPVARDAALNTAYSNLSTEHKILKQELFLSRKEGDALRSALEGRGAAGSPELVARLNETTKELAALRASYSKLQSERASAAGNLTATAESSARLTAALEAAAKSRDLEEKLAASLRNYTQLQEENSRLRTDIDRSRAENTTLTTQVKTLAAQNEQTQNALAQLNTELLAQKDARARAEQQAAANAAQLAAVIAQAGAKPATLADTRAPTSAVATTLTPAAPAKPVEEKLPSFGEAGGTTAELRTNPARLRPAPAPIAPEALRVHVVTATDTLEKIAQKYYGDPGRWRTIYFANNSQLSGGRPLKPGMQLEIPRD
jgi:hypothetical protein